MDPIRVCFFKIFAVVHLIDNQEGQVFSRKPRFGGFYEVMMNALADVFFIPPFNYTLQSSSGKNTFSNLTGCTGLLQQGGADVSMMTSLYPSMAELDVRQIISERTLDIVSTYNMTQSGRAMSVLDSFNSLSLEIWLTLIFSCILLATVIRKLTFQRRTNVLNIVLLHIFRQGVLDLCHWFPRSLSVLMSCLVLFVSITYSCLIKTESVVIEKPFLIKNYDDIIAKIDVMTPKFLSASPFVDEFKHARHGSKESLIWTKIKGRNHTYERMQMVPCFTDMRLGKSCQIMDSLNSQKQVSGFCALKVGDTYAKQFKGTFPWIATDPSSRKLHYGFPFRTGVNRSYQKRVLRRAGYLLEHGIYLFAQSQLKPHESLVEPNEMGKYRRCISGKLQMPDSGYHPLTVINFLRLFHWMTFFYWVTLFTLSIEVYRPSLRFFFSSRKCHDSYHQRS